MPLEITDDTFDAEVLKSELPVLVDFWAEWCGPCRMIAPVLERLAADETFGATIGKVNVDENPQAPANYGVRSIPTIALFKGGEVIDGVLGAAPQPFFAQLLDKHLEPATAEAQ